MSTTATENIGQIYDAQLKNQKSQLQQNYQQAISDLDASKKTAAKQLDQNLTATAVEAQRAQKNYGEVQSSSGLSSGAMAQARLSQNNQLQSDLTTLRAAHATADAETERQRALLGQQYAAAITQAQAENDIAKAEALYKEAKETQEKLTARQQTAAQLMAEVGDFSLYAQTYGLTPQQIATLTSKYKDDQQKDADAQDRSRLEGAAALAAQTGDFSLYQQLYGLTDEQTQALAKQFQDAQQKDTDAQDRSQLSSAAALMAQAGDFSLYQKLYGLTDEQVAKLQAAFGVSGEGSATTGTTNTSVGSYKAPDNWSSQEIRDFQQQMGISVDGIWGSQSQAAFESRQHEIANWVANALANAESASFDPQRLIRGTSYLRSDWERDLASAILAEYSKN